MLEIFQISISEWLLLVSAVVMLIGSIGLFRFKDVYTRTHAATLITVGGVCFSLLIIAIDMFMTGFISATFIEIILIIVFILISSPIASQAIVESAYKKKILPKLGIRRKK